MADDPFDGLPPEIAKQLKAMGAQCVGAFDVLQIHPDHMARELARIETKYKSLDEIQVVLSFSKAGIGFSKRHDCDRELALMGALLIAELIMRDVIAERQSNETYVDMQVRCEAIRRAAHELIQKHAPEKEGE